MSSAGTEVRTGRKWKAGKAVEMVDVFRVLLFGDPHFLSPPPLVSNSSPSPNHLQDFPQGPEKLVDQIRHVTFVVDRLHGMLTFGASHWGSHLL